MPPPLISAKIRNVAEIEDSAIMRITMIIKNPINRYGMTEYKTLFNDNLTGFFIT